MDFRPRTKKVKVFTEEQKKWIAEYRKLDRQISSTRFDFKKDLRFCKTSRLKKDVIQCEKKYEDDKIGNMLYQEKMHKKIFNLKKQVKNFQTSLTDFSKNDQYLTKIETMAEGIQLKFNEFKQDHIPKYETIQDQIDQLEDELYITEGNIEKWLKSPKFNLKKELKNTNSAVITEGHKKGRKGPVRVTNYGQELPRTVIQELYNKHTKIGNEYRKALADQARVKERMNQITERIRRNGGVNCGWAGDEHSKFMEIYFKMKGRVDSVPFMDEVTLELPLKAESEVMEHIQIYKMYVNMDKEKKELMESYKRSKEDIKFIESRYRAKEIEKQTVKPRPLSKTTMEKRKAQKEKLRKWKQDKETQRVLQKERDMEIQKLERDKKFMKRKKELQSKKMMIEEYKQMKMIEKEKQEKLKEMNKRERKYVSVEQKERIRMKEQRMLDKKKRMKSVAQQKSKTRQQRIDELRGVLPNKYGGVKPKLRDETMASLGRQRDKFSYRDGERKYANNMAGALVRNTGRAMVGWRNKI